MSFFDFKEVKENHSILDVAQRLGLELKQASNQWRGKCPSGADGDRKFVITPAKGVWYSFAVGKGGDVIALVEFVNNVSAREAAAWIMGDTAPEKKPVTASTLGGKSSEGFSPLQYLEPRHPAVEALGIEPDVAELLGIGFCPRGVLKGTVAVPVRNSDGTIAAYIGLTEIAKLPPKWMAK